MQILGSDATAAAVSRSPVYLSPEKQGPKLQLKAELKAEPKAGRRAEAVEVDDGVGLPHQPSSEAMEVEDDGDEDEVVREIDVFFSPAPLDEHAELYVIQYPLRPYWRPYEFERCEEVRVNSKQSKLEVDLMLDVESENYDQEYHNSLRIQKQTLCSSTVPFTTSYAVGLLIDNKLHMNPVHAVMQLRPSMDHIGISKSKNQKLGVDAQSRVDGSSELQASKQLNGQGKIDPTADVDDPEPWVSLEYCEVDSPFSHRYRQKMVKEGNGHRSVSLDPSDYISCLCPGTTSSDKNRMLGSLRRSLLPLPLDKRIERWFCEGPQVNRFDALMHLTPGVATENVLKLLQHYAYLVQGLWVTQSSLLCDEPKSKARDFILYLFSKNAVIPKDKLKQVSRFVSGVMPPLAVERTIFEDWKFKETTDFSFIKHYPHIVEEQEIEWSKRYRQLMTSFENIASKAFPKPNTNSKDLTSVKLEDGPSKLKAMPLSTPTASKGSLHKSVRELFEEHKVLSQNFILRQLKTKATQKFSLPKDDPKAKTAEDAATSAIVSEYELESVLKDISLNIHGVYVLKNGGHDPVRKVVIKLFQGNEANAKLKKQDIHFAVKQELGRDIKDVEYRQVMGELCESSRGGWSIKKSY